MTGDDNNLYQKVMKKGISGVSGRLGDLGKCSKKEYEDIITTACGRLNNIVVNSFDVAKQVVNFLSANKIGRATCIILEKIPEYKNYMKKPFTPLQGAVRLFDVIKPEN